MCLRRCADTAVERRLTLKKLCTIYGVEQPRVADRFRLAPTGKDAGHSVEMLIEGATCSRSLSELALQQLSGSQEPDWRATCIMSGGVAPLASQKGQRSFGSHIRQSFLDRVDQI